MMPPAQAALSRRLRSRNHRQVRRTASGRLHYNYYRDLDPQTGRYVESDPVGIDAGVNTYAYVSDDPVFSTDPFGLYLVKPGVPPPAGFLAVFLPCVESCLGSTFTVTSTSEPIKEHSPWSWHGLGMAADVRYPKPGQFDPAAFLCCAARCNFNFGLDEKLHPSHGKKTYPHLHIQLPKGSAGGRGDLPSPDCKPSACKT